MNKPDAESPFGTIELCILLSKSDSGKVMRYPGGRSPRPFRPSARPDLANLHVIPPAPQLRKLIPYFFILPVFALVAMSLAYPAAFGTLTSFFSDASASRESEFVGFEEL